MTVAAHATGTQSTTGSSTEDFLSSPNAVNSYQLVVDLNDMAAGDAIRLRVYQIVLTSGTVRVVWEQYFYDAQPAWALIAHSPIVSNELTDSNSVRFSVTQTLGTAGISVPWKVLKFF